MFDDEPSEVEWTTLGKKSLPSAMIPYPEGTEINIRNYSLGEMKTLSSVGIPVSVILEYGIQRGVKASKVSPSDLSLQDAMMILLSRKIMTQGNHTYFDMVYCPACGEKQEISLDASEVEFEDLQLPSGLTLPLRVKLSSGEVLPFNVITVSDYVDVKNLLRDAEDERFTLCEDVLYLAAMLKKEELSLSEKFDLIYNITDSEDIEAVSKVDEILSHSILPVTRECKKCAYRFSVRLGLEVPNLRPFRKREDVIADKFLTDESNESGHNVSESEELR